MTNLTPPALTPERQAEIRFTEVVSIDDAVTRICDLMTALDAERAARVPLQQEIADFTERLALVVDERDAAEERASQASAARVEAEQQLARARIAAQTAWTEQRDLTLDANNEAARAEDLEAKLAAVTRERDEARAQLEDVLAALQDEESKRG